jgi:hypothetical protein
MPPGFVPTGEAAERFSPLIARQLGAQKLGYSPIAMPPGKRAYPAPTAPRFSRAIFIKLLSFLIFPDELLDSLRIRAW